ncbi:transposase [Streptomyces sp. NBC_00343]|uniref:transposase n=1 Tax=unclassified Streptomyces TaxID=2593676 RepID=UPI003FA767FF
MLSTTGRRHYPSDTTARERAPIEPLFPLPACQPEAGGRRDKRARRDIVDAIRHLVDNGVKWRALPAGLPLWRTVSYHFAAWRRRGVIALLRGRFRRRVRAGRG